MGFKNSIIRRIREVHLSIKAKITLSLSAICAILLISSIISVIEYSNMSNYVSSLIADNVNSINSAQRLSDETNRYNLDILATIGDDTKNTLPDFDQTGFMERCDSLRSGLAGISAVPLTDSILYAFSAYMLASKELPQVLESDFIDTRTWYFERLQPLFTRLHGYMDRMSAVIYSDLKTNSETFDRGFYRSIIPGIVAVGVGLLLVLMLMFYINAYYVGPLGRMLTGLKDYRSYNRRYLYHFDGDDELVDLNDGIAELANENIQLRKRITRLKEKSSEQ